MQFVRPIPGFRRRLPCAAALLALAAWASPASAQTFKLVEDFEDNGSPTSSMVGPPNLTAAGWSFRNQSEPMGVTTAWLDSLGSAGPNTGQGFLTSRPTTTSPLQLSNWAVLPEVPGQAAGDVLAFWTVGGALAPWEFYLEVRYSASGGTSTGTGADDVGDFDQLLFDSLLPLSAPFVYHQIQVTLPGPGRLALRYRSPQIGWQIQSSALIAFDTLTVGEAPGAPCGLALPEAGETVTWDAAGSPYSICQDLIVPAGATLVVGPGAVVSFEPGKSLIVEGDLQLLGTAANPVVVANGHVSSFRVRGSARLEHADVSGALNIQQGASFEAFDSLFHEGARFSPSSAGTFVRLERCELRSDWVEFIGTAVLEDVSLTNPSALVDLRGFWRTENLSSLAPLSFTASAQDRLIDEVTVTGVTWAPALELLAYESVVDFRLGQDNVLVGNQHPVWARHAGLHRSSTVPLTGNLRNAILAPEDARAHMRSRLTLPDFGIAYDVDFVSHVKGDLRIDPGTRFSMGPQGGISVGGDTGSDTRLRGLPGQPLVFEPRWPGQRWSALTNAFGLGIFEHLDIDGATTGVNAVDTLLLRDSTIRNCDRGTMATGSAAITASGNTWSGNQTGLWLDGLVGGGYVLASGAERPNSFVGNEVGAYNAPTAMGGLYPFEADNNWWGASSGPYSEVYNPGGEGDEASFGVEFEPFLTAAPDLSDQRPVVRLVTRLHPVVQSGEKLFVEWTAQDDGTLTGFDVQWFDPQRLSFADLATGLPGSTRRFELVVPDIGFANMERMPFRILAHDDAGQTGIEQFELIVPADDSLGTVTFTTPLGDFVGGEKVTICYDALGIQASSFTQIRVETTSDDRIGMKTNGSAGPAQCSLSPLTIPHASTDRARLALRAEGNGSRDEWYFSDWFTIRPDPRLGDAPPAVHMTAPLAGQRFSGGSRISVQWTASDDVALYEFRIQASLNGGRTYQTIAEELPPSARSFDWRLPDSTGIDDLRVRVVAVDSYLQNSASGDDRSLQVVPGRLPRREALDPTVAPGPWQ